jgi:peptidoglycan DL-endopeptidase CwlO
MSEIGAFGKGPRSTSGRATVRVPGVAGTRWRKGVDVHFESDNRLDPRRTGEGKAPVRIHGSRWNNSRGGIAAVTVGLLLLAGSPVASGAPSDPSEPTFPSQQEVDAARQHVEDTARSVADIQADYQAADQQLQSLSIAASQAAEAYNGAMWRLQQARSEAKTARLKADRADARITHQRAGIGALVADTYQGGADLSQVSAYLVAKNPDALLDRFAVFKGASSTMQARLDRFRAAYTMKQVFEREARVAVAEADRAEQEAAAARQRAAEAMAAQQAAVSEISARKDALVQELAQAQDVSVELAQQRQQALERRAELRRQRAAERAAELARQRAAAEARREAQEARQARQAAQAEARAEAREAQERAREAQEARERAQEAAARRAAEQRADARAAAAREAREAREEARQARQQARQARIEARQERIEARQERREARQERLQRMRQQRQQRQATAYSGGGASQAVSFAMDQLGDSYVWGAAGPDAWDCSGLTSVAWGSAGHYLPHYSVAQYYATTPISYSALRPGDLIFWSSNGAPSGIFHVAMYIGNGQMVHAANPSDPVKVSSVWYWESPDFFTRV